VISSVPGNSVALTIDDGPDPHWTPQILDLLAAQGVLATFCLIGQEVRAHPDLVRRIVDGGHTLCDHTESHDIRLPSRSRATVDREVGDAYDEIVTAAGGVRPRLFRAPGGNWSPEILAAAAQRDMRGLGWDVDTRDWTRPGPAAIAAAVGHAPAGSVILVHDGGGDRSQTVAALRTALSELRHRGLTFVIP
jgi:peptidoglycan/xylan/chitin deacetylase (PgdA/CDA1 family)